MMVMMMMLFLLLFLGRGLLEKGNHQFCLGCEILFVFDWEIPHGDVMKKS